MKIGGENVRMRIDSAHTEPRKYLEAVRLVALAGNTAIIKVYSSEEKPYEITYERWSVVAKRFAKLIAGLESYEEMGDFAWRKLMGC